MKLLKNDAGDKIAWQGVLLSVQPRIRLTRSFDQRSCSLLRLNGPIWRRLQLAIPSEEIFDRIEIAHMTEDGRIQSPTTKDMMPPTVEGLLDAWLNVEKSGGISLVDPLKSITVVAPFVDSEGEITTRKRTITFNPGA